jgi:hypothetical protein
MHTLSPSRSVAADVKLASVSFATADGPEGADGASGAWFFGQPTISRTAVRAITACRVMLTSCLFTTTFKLEPFSDEVHARPQVNHPLPVANLTWIVSVEFGTIRALV